MTSSQQSPAPSNEEEDRDVAAAGICLSDLSLARTPPFAAGDDDDDVAYAIDEVSPLLLYYKKLEDGACNYYSPAINKSFAVSCPHDLSGTIFHCASSDGWLLLSRGEFEMFMVNPFTGAYRNIPNLNIPNTFSVITFSNMASDDDFMVVGIRCFHEFAWVQFCQGGGDWSELLRYEFSREFKMCDSNPVYHRGLLHLLGTDGTLATFEPDLNEHKWEILDKPGPVDMDVDDIEQCFLVECKGELMSVFIERDDKFVSVFKLNQEMEWEEVSSLEEEQALFVGCPNSIASKVPEAMQNKVFLPRVFGKPEMIPVIAFL